jgi:fructose/tagatose bisphosphate aldolase
MANPKYFIGPMSKNIVDAIIEFCNDSKNTIGLIPSRRQIEWNGGYVNNWITKNFSEYVSRKSNNIILQRDHSGPGQGQQNDNGFISLVDDCTYLDLIHIDPWKKYPEYIDGLEWTVEMIKVCDAVNSNLKYEIGTEEAIRRFEPEDLDRLVCDLKEQLGIELFSKIKYLVIQSGTSLKGTNQTGHYDSQRLVDMINVAKKHNLLSKEHNGDYIPVSVIKEKFDLGLDAINIAPEFGLIETQTYIDVIKQNDNWVENLNTFWKICFDSKKWEKWVGKDFNPYNNQTDIIKICGHYVLSYPEFLSKIKSQFPNIDQEIKNNIKNKLKELYGY